MSIRSFLCSVHQVSPSTLRSDAMRKAMAAAPQSWGRLSRSWIVICVCAFHLDLFLFAAPKQPGSQALRQKEGLYVNSPVAGGCDSVVNYPGVTLDPTKEDKQLTSRLNAIAKANKRPPGAWKKVKQLISNYTGYSPLVFTPAMQVAFQCRRFLEGAKMFERLRAVKAPMTLPVSWQKLAMGRWPFLGEGGVVILWYLYCSPLMWPKQCQTWNCQMPFLFEVYAIALKLYGKLQKLDEVRELWAELQGMGHVNKLLAQARLTAAADNGDIDSAREVLAYMEKKGIKADRFHMSSAINACANSNDENRARDATSLFHEMLNKGLEVNIVTYSSLVRSLKGSPNTQLLDLLDNMKAQGVKANNVFAENLLYIFLKKPSRKGCWMNEDAITADLEKLGIDDLKVAKDVLDEFKASGIKLNKSCILIGRVLESLLR